MFQRVLMQSASAGDLKNSREMFLWRNVSSHVRSESKLTCCEALRFGFRGSSSVRGSRGFCGAWGPFRVLRALFFLCVRVCVCFFALSCWYVFSFAFELLMLSIILSVFLFAVLNCLKYIIVLTWTIWSTCTFGHAFKLP